MKVLTSDATEEVKMIYTREEQERSKINMTKDA